MIEESWLLSYIQKAKDFGATVALDIGANVGTWTALLAEHFDLVIAVEPDHRAFAVLTKLASNMVMCLHQAVTSKVGAVELHLRQHSVQSSLLDHHPVGAGGQSEAPIIETAGVNGVTMDFLLFQARQRFGDLGRLFIKVDVEGAEGDVLAGATEQAFRDAAWLIEIHAREQEVGIGLRDLGYDGLSIIPHPSENAHPQHGWIYTEPGYAHS